MTVARYNLPGPGPGPGPVEAITADDIARTPTGGSGTFALFRRCWVHSETEQVRRAANLSEVRLLEQPTCAIA